MVAVPIMMGSLWNKTKQKLVGGNPCNNVIVPFMMGESPGTAFYGFEFV